MSKKNTKFLQIFIYIYNRERIKIPDSKKHGIKRNKDCSSVANRQELATALMEDRCGRVLSTWSTVRHPAICRGCVLTTWMGKYCHLCGVGVGSCSKLDREPAPSNGLIYTWCGVTLTREQGTGTILAVVLTNQSVGPQFILKVLFLTG